MPPKLKLNTTSSIVDFLKSKGQPSSFSARKTLFNKQGLGSRLGDFVGSGAQNRALLKSAQQSENATPDVVRQFSSRLAGIDLNKLSAAGAASTTQAAAQQPVQAPPQVAQAAQAAAQAPPPTAKPSVVDDIKQGLPPETFQPTEIPTPEAPSAQDILSRARGETGVQIAAEEAKIGKERIQAALPAQLTTIKGDFASRGLVFSGARTAAEQGARDEALQKELDIDIRFAKILGTAIDRAQSELGKEIEDVIADAQNRRQEDIDFLADIGLAVDPRTGELFPTLQAGRDELSAARLEVEQAREERIAATTSADQARADRRLQIAESAEIRAQEKADEEGGPEEFSASEKKKLEQAGLLEAPREEQLEFLFGGPTSLPLEVRFDDARAIVRANVVEKIFGKKGKFAKGVSEEELIDVIRQTTELPVGDIKRLIDEVLGEKIEG